MNLLLVLSVLLLLAASLSAATDVMMNCFVPNTNINQPGATIRINPASVWTFGRHSACASSS
jgi:hypothetical protein